MRDFCKISPQFWIGKTGKEMRGDMEAQIVAMYLMTSPHSNMIGIFSLPTMYLAHETGIPIEGASKALQRVCAMGFCTFEADSELVWVHEMAKYQIGEQLDVKDKRCKGVQNELAKVPSPQLRKAFSVKYKDDFHLIIEGKKSKPLPSPSQAPRKQGEGEGEGEGEPSVQELFDSKFWPAYPKKVGKDAAFKAFEKRSPDSELAGLMVKAIEDQAKTPQWKKDGGQFIPNPATWLNEGRWQDAPIVVNSKNDDWWSAAGFDTEWDARNNQCAPSSAKFFRDGKRITEVV